MTDVTVKKRLLTCRNVDVDGLRETNNNSPRLRLQRNLAGSVTRTVSRLTWSARISWTSVTHAVTP
jgi:hypothetical protein